MPQAQPQQIDLEDAGQPLARGKKVVKKKVVKGPKARPLVPQHDDARAEAPVRRAAPRPNPRYEGTREPAREVVRSGAVVVEGRTGEQLTRRRTGTGDKYEINTSEVPRGWTYQWNPVTVLNQSIKEIIVQGDLQMHENGWRAVPASRHPGRWTPHGYEGHIVVDGLRLEERPASLTDEAQQEDTMRAKAQVRDRTDALRMTQKSLPGAQVARQRGHAGGMKMDIDPALDIPHPSRRIDDGTSDGYEE